MSAKVLALCLFVAGCHGGDDGPANTHLHVTLDAPEIIEIAGDVTDSITAHVTRDDGSPASGYTFRVHAGCTESARCNLIIPTSGTGTETILVHPLGYSVGEIVALASPTSSDENTVGSEHHALYLVPDTGTWLQAPVTETRLAPGERRPVAGLVHAEGGDNGLYDSGVHPAYTVDDPTVATVDGDGVVTGIAAGATTLHLAASGLTTTVEVVVDDALVVGPPPEGIADLDPVIPPQNTGLYTMTSAAPRSEHKLVIDSRGYPHAIARFGHRALLLAWTGTGYGTELLPDVFDGTEQASIGIDGHDRIYVLTAGSTTHLYDRVTTAVGPATWARRTLPYHVDALDALIAADPDRVGVSFLDYLRAQPDPYVSMLPNAGDGIELVYRVIARGDVAGADHDCESIYRYAAITADRMDVTDLAMDPFPKTAGDGQCDAEAPKIWQPFVLARGADGTTQFVLPNANRAPQADAQIFAGDAVYTRDGGGAWSTPPGVPNMHGGHFPVPDPPTSIDVVDLPFAADGTPTPSKIYEALAGVTLDAPFVFGDGGRSWYGITRLAGVVATEPDGTTHGDFVPAPSNPALLGIAARAHRLAALTSDDSREGSPLSIEVVDAPPPLSASASETVGRLAQGVGAGPVFAPDAITAGGTRYALALAPGAASGDLPHLYKSLAVDGAWQQLSPPAVTFGDRAPPLVERAGALFAFDPDGALLRSTDGGATFAAITGAAPEFQLAARLEVGDAGAVYLQGGTIAFAAFHASAQTSPWASITMPTMAPNGWSIVGTPIVLADATGFTFLMQVIGGSAPPQIYLRRYDWTGAVVTERNIGTVDGISHEDLHLAELVRAADGGLVFLGSISTGTTNYTLRGHHLDLATDTWSAAPIDTGFIDLPTDVVALGGGFAVATARAAVDAPFAGRVDAEILTSADGLHWSAAATQPAIAGGVGQLKRLLADGHGGLSLLAEAGLRFGAVWNAGTPVLVDQ